MANGIDSQYTGIGRVPIVQEDTTSVWDAIAPLAQMAKADKARQEKLKLDYAKLHQQGRANDDLKAYREDSLDQQSKELEALNTYRKNQTDIAQTNAQTASSTQKANEQFQKDTTFINRVKLLPEGERLREILLHGAEDPGYMKRSGTSVEKINERINNIEDYKMDMTRASGFIQSNNPLQVKYHMRKLMDGNINTNEAARDIYATLQKRLPEAEKYQNDLYEVTPKEIAGMYPQYASNLESLTKQYSGKNVTLDPSSIDFKSMKDVVPLDRMEAYNTAVTKLTKGWANKYRIDKGIGTYDPSSRAPDPLVGPPTPLEAIDKIEITPDDFTLSEERYELIEKAQEENNPLWEKWLNEEDYTFADLKMDYEAGQPELEEKEKVEVETKIKPEDDPAKKATETDTKDMTPKAISMSLMPPEEMTPARPTPPMMDATYKGQKINLPMWKELYGRSKHPVTKKAIPEYAWMDDYAKMLTGDPNAEAEDLLTKKGRKYWKNVK